LHFDPAHAHYFVVTFFIGALRLFEECRPVNLHQAGEARPFTSRLASNDKIERLAQQISVASPFADNCRAGDWLDQSLMLTE
jgi:hypothetical protein